MNLLLNASADIALADSQLHNTVKMAYLDPPYNTGRKFAQYSDSSPVKDWLAMLERTLTGVRATLTEDGSVFVHLDDKYIHRVRCVMDDVFGEQNYIGTMIWEKKNRASYLHAQLADVTDHILIYAKDKSKMAPLVHSATAVGKRIPVHNKGNKPSVLEFPAGSMTFNFSDRTVPAGEMNTPTIESALLDDLIVENGTNKNAFRMSGPFRYGQDAVTKMGETPGAFIAPKPLLRPSFLSTEAKGKVLTNLQSFRVNGSPTNEDARAESELIFGTEKGDDFDTPKPEALLERLIAAATQPGDRVLDCFAGSGTTLAVAQKMGRAWTGVELSPKTISNFIQPRLDGILAGTDPLPLDGYTASAQAYTVSTPEYAAAA
ncbi:site-specific DNA-methyltransferase [Pseudarthrobacter sp. BIM B-2242]|uniref:site-specific DNA-methyltransferase n=1 Tax=Pseudarthrobacter sp. BIM B-2242 TaxID=2772401 RepID=UPI00168B3288|nr:site-specific DNA-methyltransferase [Pseudarthrobacter sp. BIM B-2242]QOD05905.1 site-specific DNA-methyltransferase [Pseudarthrobacter sp. BIM B-2242]